MSVIWIGASSLAEKLFNKWIRIYGDTVPRVILDNDPQKRGRLFNGITIDLVTNINEYLQSDSKIIITSSYVAELQCQLSELGVKHSIMDYSTYDSVIFSHVLNKNKQLKDKRKTDRCFIIGNGPSLKSINLSKLAQFDCIAVNHAYKSHEIVKLSPQFWILADPLFWLKSDLLLEPIINVLSTQLPDTRLLVNAEALHYFDRQKAEMENLYFYDMSSGLATDEIISCDFSVKMQHCAQNVLCPAILLALYIGYEEICLVGFDHTWWAFTKDDILSGKVIPHVYQNTSVDDKISLDAYKELGFYGLRETIERQKLEYGYIRRLAEKRGQKIYNITSGELDCFVNKKADFFL
ncbi:hypothetical protein [Aeromonas enteropelogenes]|uniref:hypothetical protein n=1 Tax=Aeromonas enteropelogenes TaxID=29489 RepID=UPI0012E90EDA|nr:hypothetical protein [Aeromonas enteropelogenes]